MPRPFLVSLALGAFLAAQAHAQTVASYDACIALAQREPVAALSAADGWFAQGGGDAARHCRAMALASLGSFAEAARTVEELAAVTGDMAGQADLHSQAGDFLMAAGDAAAARAAFDRALALEPQNVMALDGQARAAAAQRDFATAIMALDNLLWMGPNDAEALALRAAARRRSGDRIGARNDAEAAVAANPNSAVAYFERGAIRAVEGDLAGARADWSHAEALDPGGETGQLALTNRQRLP